MNLNYQIARIERELQVKGRIVGRWRWKDYRALTPGRKKQLLLKKRALEKRAPKMLWETKRPVTVWNEVLKRHEFSHFETVKPTYEKRLHGRLGRKKR